MLTSNFDYNLPPELIAQMPTEPRDSSKLMVVNRDRKTIEHRHFFDIINFLQEGDLLVWNNSKVFKARLMGQVLLDNPADGIEEKFEPTEKILNMSKVEILLVRPMENKFVWKVLARPGKKLRLGMKVKFADDFVGEVLLKEADGTILMQFADEDFMVREKANRYGTVPVPPYITSAVDRSPSTVDGGPQSTDYRLQQQAIDEQYQTVYAKQEGSVAAPTAGFHFTRGLIERLNKKGIQFAEVTLHVGLGTFLPVKSEKIEDHRMHSEWVELTAKNADLINAAKAEGRRVIAVGTTSVRVLEGVARAMTTDYGLQTTATNNSAVVRSPSSVVHTVVRSPSTVVRPYTGDINIFITPGFKFQIVDALITNFHLPKSTLLMLVSAFAEATTDKSAFASPEASADKSAFVEGRLAGHSPSEGRKFVLECYRQAIEEKYRFYSFGDAMLII